MYISLSLCHVRISPLSVPCVYLPSYCAMCISSLSLCHVFIFPLTVPCLSPLSLCHVYLPSHYAMFISPLCHVFISPLTVPCVSPLCVPCVYFPSVPQPSGRTGHPGAPWATARSHYWGHWPWRGHHQEGCSGHPGSSAAGPSELRPCRAGPAPWPLWAAPCCEWLEDIAW